MPAIDLTKVESTKALIHSDLIISMTGVTNKDLLDLGVNIIQGVENEDKIIVYKGYRQMASRYQVNQTSRSKLGKAYERVLKVVNDIVYVPDNVQNYREKIYDSMLKTSSNGATTDLIEQRLRMQATQFGSHVVDNFFHGDKTNPVNAYYGLYDGILAWIEKDKTEGLIAAGQGNYIAIGRLDLTNPAGCYDKYVQFCQSIDPALAKNCTIVTTPKAYNAIVRGYALTFVGNQQNIIPATSGTTFVSHETDGCVLKKTTLLGTGDGFIAYKPGNLDYATDLTGGEDPSQAYIDIIKDPSDHLNSLLIGMQCASGTRVRDFNKEAFAISDYSFTAPVIADNTPEMIDFANEDFLKQVAAKMLEIQASAQAANDAIADGPHYIYTAVDSTAAGYSEKNPSTEGWYERSGTEGNYTYTLSEETSVGEKTYYARSVA